MGTAIWITDGSCDSNMLFNPGTVEPRKTVLLCRTDLPLETSSTNRLSPAQRAATNHDEDGDQHAGVHLRATSWQLALQLQALHSACGEFEAASTCRP